MSSQQNSFLPTIDVLSKLPPINCILAIDKNMGIGYNGRIPWNLPIDRQMFNKITTYSENKTGPIDLNIVIMGRKTWDSLDEKYRPLPNRINIVVSTSMEMTTDEEIENLKIIEYKTSLEKIVVNNMNSLFDKLEKINKKLNINQIFVIGGKYLYDYFFRNSWILHNLFVTFVSGDYDTDVKVNFIQSDWSLVYETINGVNTEMRLQSGNTKGILSIFRSRTNYEEIKYLEMMSHLIKENKHRPTRNGNTICGFAHTLSFNLIDSFPLITTKKMFLRGIFEELKFFLMGSTNTKILEENKVNIWKGNTSREFLDSVGLTHLEEGDMGPLYGFQLRHYGAEYKGCKEDYTNAGYDQLANVLNLLKTDKYSRRIMMTTYNPAQVSQGPLPPCHGIVIQFGVEGQQDDLLSCHMYQRSCDSFLGLPFNISSYALLVYIICELVNNDENYTGVKLRPGKLTISLGDYHIYKQHLEVVNEQILRIPYMFPKLSFNKKITKIEELEYSNLELINYRSHETLKAEMVA